MRGWLMVAAVAVGSIVLVVLAVRALLGGRKVPAKAKLAIAGAVVWLVSPIDALPDLAGPVGLLDDVVVLIAAVRYVLDRLQPLDTPAPVQQRVHGRRPIDASDWRLSDDPRDRT